MIIDHRTYRILPGRVPAQLELYSKLGYPLQLRYMGEPHYYLATETGQLNTLVHGWVYDIGPGLVSSYDEAQGKFLRIGGTE